MFSDSLKSLRESSKMSQKMVAEKIEVTQPTIAAYESGKREPDLRTLCKLAQLFDVSTDYLLGLSQFKSKHEAFIVRNESNEAVAALATLELTDRMNFIELMKCYLNMNLYNSGEIDREVFDTFLDVGFAVFSIKENFESYKQAKITPISQRDFDFLDRMIISIDKTTEDGGDFYNLLSKAKEILSNPSRVEKDDYGPRFSFIARKIKSEINEYISELLLLAVEKLDSLELVTEEGIKSNGKKENDTQCPRCGYDTPKG